MNSFRESLKTAIGVGLSVYGVGCSLSMINGAYIGYRMKRETISFIPSMETLGVEPEDARMKAIEEEKTKAKAHCMETMVFMGCERGLKAPLYLWKDPQVFINSWFWSTYANRTTIQCTSESMTITF